MRCSTRMIISCMLMTLFYVVHGDDCPTSAEERTVYKDTEEYITSENYDVVNQTYSNNSQCHWKLRAQTAYLKVKVEVIDLHLDTTGSCLNDYIQFFDGPDSSSKMLKKICENGNDVISSTQQYMYVYFYSDANNTGDGFKLKYYAVEHDDVTLIYMLIVAGITVGGALTVIFGILICNCVCTNSRRVCVCCREGDGRTRPKSMMEEDFQNSFGSADDDKQTESNYRSRNKFGTSTSPPPSYNRTRR